MNALHDCPLNAPEEIEDLERLALVGELASTLVHDCNNFLNVVLLQVAVLELNLDSPAELQSQLGELRGEGNRFKSVLDQWHLHGHSKRPQTYPVDLNAAVRGAVDSANGQFVGLVRLELSPGSLEVTATVTEIKRLATLLLADQVRKGAGREIVVRTEERAGSARLCVVHARAGRERPEPPISLELSACRLMARRIPFRIYEENLANDAVQTVVEFFLHG